ncbi:hypothetical protein [Phenylobacterium sp.]|jgi:hypothetical protein|uniref:hypothetical protein n=1 Tax=Phenylobacterium sp. TaxID=1871053 RepID=UPI002F40643F
MRRVLASAAIAVSLVTLAGAGRADPDMVWIYMEPSHPQTDPARLAYGVPATEDGLISIDCRPGSGTLSLTTWIDPDPHVGRTTLRAGAARSVHSSKTEPNDIAEGVAVETSASTQDPAIRAFRKGAALSVITGRSVTRLPPVTRAAAEPFFRVCGG